MTFLRIFFLLTLFLLIGCSQYSTKFNNNIVFPQRVPANAEKNCVQSTSALLLGKANLVRQITAPARISELNIGKYLGHGAEKIAYDIGNGEVAILFQRYDNIRRGMANTQSLTPNFLEAFIDDFLDLKILSQKFSKLKFNGQLVFPDISRAIHDENENVIGYISERVEGYSFDKIAKTLSHGERQEVARQARAQLGLIYEQGLMHGDPHAGNIMVSRDSSGHIEVRFIDFTPATSSWQPKEDFEIFTNSMNGHAVPNVNLSVPKKITAGQWEKQIHILKNISALEIPPMRSINGVSFPRTDSLPPHNSYHNIIEGMLDHLDEGNSLGKQDERILEEFIKIATSVALASGDKIRISRITSSDINVRTEALLAEGKRIVRSTDGRNIIISVWSD